jgi:hypothetical protein
MAQQKNIEIKYSMNDNEIYEMINAQIDAALEREDCHIKQLQDALCEELENYRQANKSNSKQMAIIETMIHQHAIGVQNVYNEILEMKRIYQLTQIDKELFDKIEKIKSINDILYELK